MVPSRSMGTRSRFQFPRHHWGVSTKAHHRNASTVLAPPTCRRWRSGRSRSTSGVEKLLAMTSRRYCSKPGDPLSCFFRHHGIPAWHRAACRSQRHAAASCTRRGWNSRRRSSSASSSPFFIHEITDVGTGSPIDLLSIYTLIVCHSQFSPRTDTMWCAIDARMLGLFLGALVIAGLSRSGPAGSCTTSCSV